MSKAKNEPSEFDSLMQELESFSKSYDGMGEVAGKPKPKAKPKAEAIAAADGEEEEKEGEEEEMNKSVSQEGQAMDAESFMGEFLAKSKAMVIEVTENASAETLKHTALLAKALVAQCNLTKSLVEDLADLREAMEAQGEKPRMRKSVVNIHERQHGGNPGQEEAKEEDKMASRILAKCVGDKGLVSQGVVSPGQVSQIQYYANRGQALPAGLKHFEQYA